MSHKKILLLLIIALSGTLISIASLTINMAQFDLVSNDYVDRSIFSEQMPEHYTRLGLQLAYSFAREKESRIFLEQLAAELEKSGLAYVEILPALIDLAALQEKFDGVLLITLNNDVTGWQLSRRGSASVTSTLIPLRDSAIIHLRSVTNVDAAASGWLSRSYFVRRIFEFTAGRFGQSLASGLELNSEGLSEVESVPVYLDQNIDTLPSDLSIFLPPDSRLLTYAGYREYFVLTLETEDNNLESYMTEQIVNNMGMETSMDWVNATGSRRTATFLNPEGPGNIQVFYSYVEDLSEDSRYIRPGSPEPDAAKLVTIIKQQ